jgi:hypothetical protein
MRPALVLLLSLPAFCGTSARFVAFYEAGPIVTRDTTDHLDISGARPELVRGRTADLR